MVTPGLTYAAYARTEGFATLALAAALLLIGVPDVFAPLPSWPGVLLVFPAAVAAGAVYGVIWRGGRWSVPGTWMAPRRIEAANVPSPPPAKRLGRVIWSQAGAWAVICVGWMVASPGYAWSYFGAGLVLLAWGGLLVLVAVTAKANARLSVQADPENAAAALGAPRRRRRPS